MYMEHSSRGSVILKIFRREFYSSWTQPACSTFPLFYLGVGSLALWPWKLVPRLTYRGIPSAPMQTDRKDSLLQCAMNCHLLTLTCDLYDKGDYSPNTDVPGNRFYQKMPYGDKNVSINFLI